MREVYSIVKMNLNDYQEKAVSTAIYEGAGNNFIYPALGLAGEAGEIANKIKKHIRQRGTETLLKESECADIAKEVGDILWYVAVLSKEIGYTLEEIADINIKKLLDRQERGVLEGNGDNR